jgi:hypothetical protein
MDVLEYFYYGGMLYIGLKRFRDACEFLLMVGYNMLSIISSDTIVMLYIYIYVSFSMPYTQPPCLSSFMIMIIIIIILQAITAPANAISAIAVEAYKKYVLVYLIVHGDVPSLPKSTSLVVSRGLDAHAGLYQRFARVLKSCHKKATEFLESNVLEFQKV